jgi:hypothetical protein
MDSSQQKERFLEYRILLKLFVQVSTDPLVYGEHCQTALMHPNVEELNKFIKFDCDSYICD